MVHRRSDGSADGVGARGAEWDEVERLALAMPGVTAGTKYDGSPVFQLAGVFVAGLAMHRSAEAESLVVRCEGSRRAGLLEDAPETYYVTEYYRRHPVVLVRLARVTPEALRELLAASWRMARGKSR